MTQNDNWKVVCSGAIREGFDSQTVIENLAKLKMNAAQATQLVAGSPVTVKKAVDRPTAEIMQSRLEQAGLVVVIEPLPPAAEKPSLHTLSLEPIAGEESVRPKTAATPKAGNPELQAGQMQCPKCKTVQRKAAECSNCGIIISRYLEKQAREALEENDRGTPDRAGLWQAIQDIGLGKIAVVGVLAMIAVYWVAFKQLDYLPEWVSLETRAQVDATREASELESSTPDANELRQLLMAGRYDDLENILRDLDNKTREDIIWEGAYSNLLEQFFPQNGFAQHEMDQWVANMDSAWSYLVRAVYYAGAAGRARGTAIAINTSQSQLNEYRRLQQVAYKDLLTAKQKDRNLMPIYWYLLMVAASQSESISLKSLLDEAIEVNPAGYYYRYQYLRNIMPKWSGSYRKMEQFTQDTEPYYELNPRLWLLQGFAAGEKARLAYNMKDFEACIALYTEALRYGGHSGWLSHRAYCLSQTGDQNRAMKDIEWSLEIAPSEFARQVERMIKSRS